MSEVLFGEREAAVMKAAKNKIVIGTGCQACVTEDRLAS